MTKIVLQTESFYGVGRIRTGELQRPRLASYQARQRPPLFLLFIFLGLILSLGRLSIIMILLVLIIL